MKISRIRAAAILAGLLVMAGGCSTLNPAAGSSPLEASGLIEASEVALAPEIGGRVVEVSVEEGQPVRAGDPLLRLDDSLFLAQRQVALATLASVQSAVGSAQAALDAAQAAYQAALDAARAAAAPERTRSWRLPTPGRYDQPLWYFTQDEALAAARAEIDEATSNLTQAQHHLEQVVQDLEDSAFVRAENRLAQARARYGVARQVFDRSGGSPEETLRDAAQAAYDEARDALDAAQKDYDTLLTTPEAMDVLEARAELAVAQERWDTANDLVRGLSTGPLAPQVVAAQQGVQQAESGLAAAQAAVDQAQAQLDLVDAQIDKLVVRAPIDGVVLTLTVNPGEVVQAGLPVLTLGQTDPLKVTVYLPEDRYGQIHLGDHASLAVDSYPDESFDALVTRIADQAEFTPRNVQTKEERQNTVYAVELKVPNPDGKLLPGMPTDVTFHP